MRSFWTLYVTDYESDDDSRPYMTLSDKSRTAKHRSLALLASVCWNWYQTLAGWPQSPTPRWLRNKLKKLIKCQCILNVDYFCLNVALLALDIGYGSRNMMIFLYITIHNKLETASIL